MNGNRNSNIFYVDAGIPRMWRRPYSTGDKEATTRYGYVIERRSKGVTGYELTYLSVTQQSPPTRSRQFGLGPDELESYRSASISDAS
ncbi:Uncharacterized protein HZ326_26817 [Fusarium oxysporum f. sp. albedinis]|nr:Uncharacterized protein HZ326_26817 [Fusarium oxysporum f. sp. albedinis]